MRFAMTLQLKLVGDASCDDILEECTRVFFSSTMTACRVPTANNVHVPMLCRGVVCLPIGSGLSSKADGDGGFTHLSTLVVEATEFVSRMTFFTIKGY